MFKKCLSFTLVIAACWLFSVEARAQGTAFTYQGKVTDSGSPANGSYDMQFKLFDLSGGTQQGSTLSVTNVTVTAGIFTVQLDFGVCATCFDGSARYLEIAVKKTTDSSYTTLSPRQPITSIPYALRSLNATVADGLSVACVNCITSSQIASVSGSAVAGTIPVASVPAGSDSYIQNQNVSTQAGDFSIGGTGAANIINATTQYNLGGQRMLSAAGTFNTFTGIGAGIANTGVQNSFFGSLAGQNNTLGISNAFFGSWAGRDNTADGNSFFGAFSGRYNTTGIQNAFFGYQAGILNHTGCCNAFFGFDAGLSSNANDNSFFGNNAGPTNTTGARNSFFGSAAGYSNQTGGDNSFFGVSAGQNNKASFNTFVGSSAGLGNTSGGFNSFFGYLAGLSNTTQHDNTFIGNGAGRFTGTNDTTGNANFNTFVGSNAGVLNTTGSLNTFIGAGAGFNNNAEHDNIFIGASAGVNNGTGDTNNLANFNTFIGNSAGSSNTTGDSNSFFGAFAGRSNTTANSNSFFGVEAGKENTTQFFNTFIGYRAGFNNGMNDPNNLANFNTFVGNFVGLSNKTGGNNTLIGQAADVGADGLVNATAIGRRATVSQSNSLVLGSINGINGATTDTNVGIGTTAPGFKLHIAGHTNSNWPIIKLQNVDSGGHSYWLYAGAGGTTTDFGIYDETLNAYRIYINGSNGNVGINIAPVDRLDVFGDIRVGAINGCVRDRLGNVIAGACGSDARLKRDITPFPRLLEKVVQLQPVNFYWRTEQFPERHFGSSQSFGLVAQEVEKVLPELVSEDEQGYKVVHYQKLPLLMLQAMKELKEENDSFRHQIKERERQASVHQDEINRQQLTIEGLKKLVCQDHPNAEVCK